MHLHTIRIPSTFTIILPPFVNPEMLLNEAGEFCEAVNNEDPVYSEAPGDRHSDYLRISIGNRFADKECSPEMLELGAECVKTAMSHLRQSRLVLGNLAHIKTKDQTRLTVGAYWEIDYHATSNIDMIVSIFNGMLQKPVQIDTRPLSYEGTLRGLKDIIIARRPEGSDRNTVERLLDNLDCITVQIGTDKAVAV
ncbi:hypothetical protein [Neptuniibacter sp. QD37_11]|uniref:hypothetical protein n=1 Tax=Neptuniibacter sp. QD37_11 TaxID=3398209 RepID=UPI0039F49CC0